MRVRHISIEELGTFIGSEEFRRMPDLPISSLRARSQASNPLARAEDVALILFYEKDELLAYLGLLPDQTIDTAVRFAWMSCIWVSPTARGRGLAGKLLEEAFNCWEAKLLATEFTAPAKRLYDKTGRFDDLALKQGIRAYLRLNMADLLLAKNPKYAPYKSLLRLGDGCFNALNSLRLWWKKTSRPSNVRLAKFDEVDEDAWQFLKRHAPPTAFQRNRQALNWLLKNPWLSSDDLARKEQGRYQFSVYADHFEFVGLKIFEGDVLKAWMILACRNRALKIPYIFLQKGCEAMVAKEVENYMLSKGLYILTTYDSALRTHWQKHQGTFFLIRPFNRPYLISKALKSILPVREEIFQDGEGDCAFT
ncbi:MAG: GNAT family N-acetyltransferase [Bacteroidota bacterium]